MLDLEDQLVGAGRLGRAMVRAVDAVDSQRMHVADGAIVNPLDDLLPRLGVPPHEAGGDFEPLLLGDFD